MIRMRYYNNLQIGDMVFDGHHLETDDGLETAVLLSLHTDRRATKEQYQQFYPWHDITTADLRGVWFDALLPEIDRFGSLLWLLSGSKINAETAAIAKGFIEDCLRWMIQRGIAERIEVTTTVEQGRRIVAEIKIVRPGELIPTWSRQWEVVSAN